MEDRRVLGTTYEDVENLRAETREMVATWLQVYGDAKHLVTGVEAQGEPRDGPHRRPSDSFNNVIRGRKPCKMSAWCR